MMNDMPKWCIERKKERQGIIGMLADLGSTDDEGCTNKDILIDEIIQRIVNEIVVSLDGNKTNIKLTALDVGAEINEHVKQGMVEASNIAKTSSNTGEILSKLYFGVRNIDATRDHVFPKELTFQVGVGILMDNYKKPLEDLVASTFRLLISGLKKIFKKHCGPYPRLEKLGIALLKLYSKVYFDKISDNCMLKVQI